MAGLHLRFRSAAAGLDVDLDLPRHGITALFGPSGSGKTTCLRVVAGLDRLAGARVVVGDEVWQDERRFVPVHRRALGYVFQEASLFTHLTVRANLAFGQQRVPPQERRFSLDAVTGLLGIGHLLERYPQALSGGERQRVAIARALLASPRLLLMDEPLAALDLARKQEILPYLERLRDELAIPILYVSHALDEVTRLADHLVLLDGGRVRASGPLAQTLAQAGVPGLPAHDAGAVFDTVLVGEEEDGLSRLEFAGGVLRVDRRTEAPGSRLRCHVPAREVSLALARPVATSSLNVLEARVVGVDTEQSTGSALVRLLVGDTELRALVPARSIRALGIGPGCRLWAEVHAMSILQAPAPRACVPAPPLPPVRPAQSVLASLLGALRRPVAHAKQA